MKSFRAGFTHGAGLDAALLVTGRVINVNLVTHTVDVRAQFERSTFYEIQVGSPYAHYSRGEGFEIIPDVGAQCVVTIPSDTAPPYVSSFLMPHEVINTATDGSPNGVQPSGSPGAASFGGGRRQ